MATGQELFARFLKGEPMSRPAFVPMVRGLPSRVDGLPFETLTADPTLWANSLVKTCELFDFDGVVVGFLFSLMAEACGCELIWSDDRPRIIRPAVGLKDNPLASERLKAALEAAGRVFSVCRHDRACVGAITGPVTLASQLFGREDGPKKVAEVKNLMVSVTEAFCQTRPDVLIFMEGRPLALAEPNPSFRRIYNTLKNILSYYNIHAGLYLQGYRPQNLNFLTQLKMDIYVLGPCLENRLPPISALGELGADALGVGLGLPLGDPDLAKKIIAEGLEYYNKRGGRGFFFTSFGPLTREINLETLHQLVEMIRQVRLSE